MVEEIKTILSKKAAEIDETLEEIMDIQGSVSETLVEAMQYTLFAGGKRVRPVLTLMVAEMIGGDQKIARKVGSAIELIHTYSLIHDDLPSMDDDKYRRGELTNHNVFGCGKAILAGDALLTYAFNLVSRLDFSSKNLIKIIEIISEGAGLQGMVGGQVLDLEGEEKNLDAEELKLVHNHKTGALFRSSILAGAYCGNPNQEEIEALTKFSYHLGLLFQIVDDILDVIGDKEKLGKRVGHDDVVNKSTYPKIMGLEKAEKEAQIQAEQACDALTIFKKDADDLKLLVDFVLNRQS